MNSESGQSYMDKLKAKNIPPKLHGIAAGLAIGMDDDDEDIDDGEYDEGYEDEDEYEDEGFDISM